VLTPVPKTWQGESQTERLGYETILETIAEKYHATEETIQKLNPDTLWPNPSVDTKLIVPNPFPFKTPLAATLKILLSEKLIRTVDINGKLIAQFPCSIAKTKRSGRPATCSSSIARQIQPTYSTRRFSRKTPKFKHLAND